MLGVATGSQDGYFPILIRTAGKVGMREMIFWLGEDGAHEAAVAGGKAAALSRLASTYRVPPGFVVTDGAHEEAVAAAYTKLGQPPVAVRSSAIDEDGDEHSFAGQHETYLNIIGKEAVLDAIRRCRESARSERAVAYRAANALAPARTLAVLVQELVPADVSAVVFTVNPLTGDHGEVVINASFGLGESIAGGTVTPDHVVVAKESLEVLSYTVGEKMVMTVRTPGATREVPIPALLRTRPAVTGEQAVEMARLALSIEAEAGCPVDVECCYGGGSLFLLQSRPITTLAGPAVHVPPNEGGR
jgi:phosphoenolpyruvate synthase/pyruvate phosphate dikinase